MYKLVARKVVPVPEATSISTSRDIRTAALLDWSVMLEENRAVASDFIVDAGSRVHVSTVFLGIDHLFGDGVRSAPILFETRVFGGALDKEQERCATWDEAIAQHAAMIARILGSSKSAKLEIFEEKNA